VQAGALTSQFDRVVKASHPDAVDYRIAEPFRALCAELGTEPAVMAQGVLSTVRTDVNLSFFPEERGSGRSSTEWLND